MVSGNSVAREQNFNIPQGSEPQQGTGQRRANNKVKPASEHKVHTRIPPAQHYWSIHLPDRRRWRNRSSTRTKINKQTWFFPKLECCHKTNICAERLIDCTRPIKPTKGRLKSYQNLRLKSAIKIPCSSDRLQQSIQSISQKKDLECGGSTIRVD